MLQIRLLGQFDVRLGGKRIVISSRAGQSLLAYLAMTAGTPHRREKLAGTLWPDSSEENARKNLRQELWRIRKAIPAQNLPEVDDYLIADEFTLTFNRDADYWLDVAILEKPDVDIQSLTSSLSLYQGELLPGFYDDWVVLERERLQTLFESKMEQLVEKLVESERWTAVQEQCERWLALGHASEPAYRALMLSYNARGDMAKVSAIYQRCVEDLRDHFGVEPSAETHALFNGLLKGAKVPRRIIPVQPSGTVTFLFTDIQGSTRLLDKLGDQYAISLAEHHRILRAAIQKWKGTEMDTQGDAFFVTFTRALDAVLCGAETQRELVNHSWLLDEPVRVRMGLHTGEPLIASTGYVGMDVHRAARIGDAAHGGQVLLSQTTRDLVMQDLPPGITIKDLGEHRLKDMKYPTPIYQLVIEGLQTDFPPLKTKFTGTEAPTPGEPPFKGLQYFEETDSDLFFGRELLTAKLVRRLRELPSPAGEGSGVRFLSVVIGASGSGKSSLVRAGLIPALKKGSTLLDGTKPPAGSTDWHVHIITPTAHPLEALATELTRDSGSMTATARLIDDLAQEPRSLALFLARARDSAKRHTVLVVDQFEELFTLCRDEFEREAFIDNLLNLVSPDQSNVTLIITLRADFYAHLAQYPELRDAVAQRQEYIGPMTADELRRAIEEPAKRGHWEFEPGLVDLILRDVGDEPGALPLLSHALLETWKRRAGHTLTLKGYADAGGVHGAIAHTAESIYQNLSPEEQAIARDIFLRLTELGEGTEDTHRRVSFEELTSSGDTDQVHLVLNKLAEARLITLGENTVEVAHEALIREWPTLREWLNQDREGLRLHRHLTEAAYEWELLGRDPGALYRGAHLGQARAWAELHPNGLNAGERTFLNASTDQEQREEREREEQRQRELAAAQKLAESEHHAAVELRRRARYLVGALCLTIFAALTAGAFAKFSSANDKHAVSALWAAEANSLRLNNADANLIALLTIRSFDVEITASADAALSSLGRVQPPPEVLSGHSGSIEDVAISPDNRYLATVSQDQTARIWDLSTGKTIHVFSGHSGEISSVAFSPDGKYLVTASYDRTARLWNVASGEVIQIFGGLKYGIESVSFSPDGKHIVTVGLEEGRVWDIGTGQTIHILSGPGSSKFLKVTYSPNGQKILTGSDDRTARLWDSSTGNEIQAFLHPKAVNAVAFSPKGNEIVTGCEDGNIRVWDSVSGLLIQEISGRQSRIADLELSPSGKLLLSASSDHTVRLWDMNTGQNIRVFGGLEATPRAVTFSQDGRLAVTAGDDKEVRVWNLRSSFPIGKEFLGTGGPMWDAAFSPDGNRVVTANNDGTAQIWEIATGQLLLTLTGHNGITRGVVFSPDGKMVLTVSEDHTAKLWDVGTGMELRRFVGHTDIVSSGVFSPDAQYVVTTGFDGTARVWETQTGKLILVYSHQGPGHLNRIMFSPDGNSVVTSADDGTARIWNPRTGEDIMIFRRPGASMTGVAFSPDGRILITTSLDGTISLWNVATGEEQFHFLSHTGYIYGAAFQPGPAHNPVRGYSTGWLVQHHGPYYVTSGADGTARLFSMGPMNIIELRRFTVSSDEVRNVVFSPDGKYILTASQDGVARLWLVNLDDTIRGICGLLTRDLTPAERKIFAISDNGPTCPAK